MKEAAGRSEFDPLPSAPEATVASRSGKIALAAESGEDRDVIEAGRHEGQLVEVVSAVEGVLVAGRVRVEVDLRAQKRAAQRRVELDPAVAANRNELLEARSSARETVRAE